jgi:hypothetical protein
MLVRLCVAVAMAVAVATSSADVSAQVNANNLVNVNIGDVTILEDVNVNLAAQVAANICGVEVGPVILLAQQVDATGTAAAVCTNRRQGPITITN